MTRATALDPALPSDVLADVAPAHTGELVQLSIEHDVCGAWITLANAGACRPVALRRAGWADLRGHPEPALGSGFDAYTDDRVGLGPGDALVLVPADLQRPAAVGAIPTSEAADAGRVLLDVVFRAAAQHPTLDAPRLLSTLADDAPGTTPLVVIRVPDELGDDRHAQLATALGVTVEELELPGYPLGDLQPGLWSRPPDPPRIARIALPPDLTHVREVRGLLRRMLSSWRLVDLVEGDDLELLATETATNAVRHTANEAAVELRYDGRAVRVSVLDRSTLAPTVMPPNPHRPGGRGMYLVETLSSVWGTTATEHGKDVWFEVPVASAG